MMGYDLEPGAVAKSAFNEILHGYMCTRIDELSNHGIDEESHYSDGLSRMLSNAMTLVDKKEPSGFLSNAKCQVIKNKLVNKFCGTTEIAPICFSDTVSTNEFEILIHAQKDLAHLSDIFDGHDTSSVNSAGFVVRNTNYSVLKEHKEGISPVRSLIISIVTHAMAIREHNNSCALVAEFSKIDFKSPFLESRLPLSDVLGNKSALLTIKPSRLRGVHVSTEEMSHAR
jgi:hypothetical protein